MTIQVQSRYDKYGTKKTPHSGIFYTEWCLDVGMLKLSKDTKPLLGWWCHHISANLDFSQFFSNYRTNFPSCFTNGNKAQKTHLKIAKLKNERYATLNFFLRAALRFPALT